MRRMTMLCLSGALVLGSTAGLLAGPISAQATAGAGGPINNNSRASVIRTYQRWLEPLLAVPVGWTGNTAHCKAGRTSVANQWATLSAVNYMRALADLPTVTLDPVRSRKSQQAALIMAANNFLSHTPPRGAKCWTKAGYDGASHGNLYLGWSFGDGPAGDAGTAAGQPPSEATGARAVFGYLVDDGGNNTFAGHRRWLLYQQLSLIGSGDTFYSNSIYVLPPAYLEPRGTTWVAWPMPGYFPRELEPKGRWSLSYPGADFRSAHVTVTGSTGSVKARKEPVAVGYGDNSLVWQVRLPVAYRADPTADFTVSVKVTGIRLPSGAVASRSWRTTFVRATAEPMPAPTPTATPVQ